MCRLQKTTRSRKSVLVSRSYLMPSSFLAVTPKLIFIMQGLPKVIFPAPFRPISPTTSWEHSWRENPDSTSFPLVYQALRF